MCLCFVYLFAGTLLFWCLFDSLCFAFACYAGYLVGCFDVVVSYGLVSFLCLNVLRFGCHLVFSYFLVFVVGGLLGGFVVLCALLIVNVLVILCVLCDMVLLALLYCLVL